MGLLNKLFNTGRNTLLTAGLATTLFFTTLFGASCGIDATSGGKEETSDPNTAPYTVSASPDPTMELDLYKGHPSTFYVVCDDLESNFPLLFEVTNGAAEVSVSNFDDQTAEILVTPLSTTPVEGSIKVTDTKGMWTEYNFTSGAITNTVSVPLEVACMDTELPLENIRATISHSVLGDLVSNTDSDINGELEVSSVPEGTTSTIVFQDMKGTKTYATYKAARVDVYDGCSRKKALLIPLDKLADLDAVRQNLAGKNVLVGWKNKPGFLIYQMMAPSGDPLPGATETIYREGIRGPNDIDLTDGLSNQTHEMEDSDISTNPAVVPSGYQAGTIRMGVNNSFAGNHEHAANSTDGALGSTLVFGETYTTAQVYSALWSAMFGGSTTTEADSILNPSSSVTTPSTKDLFRRKAIYNTTDPRNLVENQGTEDNYDVRDQGEMWK